ncbi:MAG: hypothetical protein E6342_15375 [Clostridium sp.]|uniref:hypothetical protein n=1 Tax=Clostridium TaxID=1485 RepID=UPI002902479E|nr:hypothetical protein [Clostridium sp.]MDU1280020.1 hypothetical protein [Clostridium sp.]MDU7089086.1 hypothetical protein [Clostridium sp.]
MENLFEHLNDRGKKNMKITIGQWLGREFKKLVKEKGLNIEVVNDLDRMKLAEKCLNDKMGRYTFDAFKQWYRGNREYYMHEVENNIAQFIDLKIPKNYYVCLIESLGKEYINGQYKGIDTLDGIRFIYEENYELEELTSEGTQINISINKLKDIKNNKIG